MKVVTWNCNLNLVKKFELIEQYKPDIAIIQECEKLDKSYFPNSEYWWIGKDEKKGLGIIIFNKSAKISNSYNESLIYFLPLQTDEVKILGTWAYNHRAKQRFGDGFKGGVSDAINHYKDWLLQDDKIIFEEARKYLEIFKDYPYIFNLGHGMLPETNPDKVQKLVKFVRNY